MSKLRRLPLMMQGNSFAGINDATTINFLQLMSGSRPSSTSPADNATGVAVGANIVLTFNENVAAGSGNITSKNLSDNSTVQAMPVVVLTFQYLGLRLH